MLEKIDNSVRFPHLLKCKLLHNLPDELRKDFLNSCYVKFYSEPDNFLEQGNISKGIFLLAHGSAEVSRINSSGQSTFMFHATKGNCLGEIEAIAEKECIASCSAKAGTTLLFLPTAKLLTFLDNIEFIKNLSLIFLERMEFNNSFRSIDKLDPIDTRLRAYLHFMSGESSIIDKSQADLASIICCSRQTINKELGKLRNSGILNVQNRTVIILDRDRLAIVAVC